MKGQTTIAPHPIALSRQVDLFCSSWGGEKSLETTGVSDELAGNMFARSNTHLGSNQSLDSHHSHKLTIPSRDNPIALGSLFQYPI